MTKYQQYFQEMFEKNKSAFEKFKKVHDLYATDSKKYQEEFNAQGTQILDIIRDWEKRLCSQSEKSQYGKFSSNLSDKFWGAVREHFPQIDWVGVTIS